MLINSENENILDYFLEMKNIQKEKEKDVIINKQQKDLISLSKQFIRLSQENSELRMIISLKHDVEIKLKDAEFSIKRLQEQNEKLTIESKNIESKLNQKIDKVLLEKQYERLKMEQNEMLYMHKWAIIRQIEMENEIYKEEVQNLKKQIEVLKEVTDRKMKQIEIENTIKYSQLKKKMVENLNEAKKKLANLNLKYFDTSNRVSLLQGYQLLMELEIQKSQNEQLIKENEILQKQLYSLKTEINVHKKVEVNLAQKIKKEKNKIIEPKNKGTERLSSSLLLSNKNKDIKLINAKLKRIKEGKIKNRHKNLNKSNSLNRMNKTQDILLNLNTNKLISSEENFNKFINYMKIKKKENIKLNQLNETLQSKISKYEQKFKGLYNFLEDSLNNFFNDIKNNKINSKRIDVGLENIQKFDFKEFSKEEQYNILILLMNYLLPLIYTNFSSNESRNNIFTTHLYLIDRKLNKSINYLSGRNRKGLVGNNNKLGVELHMNINSKNILENTINLLKRNNSSKIFLNKESKLLI